MSCPRFASLTHARCETYFDRGVAMAQGPENQKRIDLIGHMLTHCRADKDCDRGFLNTLAEIHRRATRNERLRRMRARKEGK